MFRDYLLSCLEYLSYSAALAGIVGWGHTGMFCSLSHPKHIQVVQQLKILPCNIAYVDKQNSKVHPSLWPYLDDLLSTERRVFLYVNMSTCASEKCLLEHFQHEILIDSELRGEVLPKNH